jgi:putative transposase
MSSYRRFREGRVYFFTVVTAARAKILTTELARDCLRKAIAAVRREHPFEIIAFALLPDHLHTVWTLPAGDSDYSTRWKLIKSRFTSVWLKAGGPVQATSFSRKQKGEHGVWQRRFFEQTCRDDADLKRCVDYIHVNPLKHGLVERVCDWPWSSFHRFVEEGEYPSNWGNAANWYGDEFRHFE